MSLSLARILNHVVMWSLYHFWFIFPDKLYLKIRYRVQIGKWPNLKAPRTYNEKLQWLKLYNHNPLYTTLVDKYAVKEYVESIIGQEYIIPTIGVWNSVDEINFELLPNQFVLKTTHGGGNIGVYICVDKSKIDVEAVKKKFRRAMRQNLYQRSREWPYKNVPKKIIAEKYMVDESGELKDYKFFCFDGEPKALFIASERNTGNVKFDFFDAKFNHLDLVQSHPMSGNEISKPTGFDKMIMIATQLSKGIPHVRIDLYSINGNIYFGEYTFFHHAGFVPFHPEKWDTIWGEWININ